MSVTAQEKYCNVVCYSSMKTLILDSSGDISILGLSEGEIPSSFQLLESRSSTLFPALKEFCDLHSLTAIAVGVGPGSYMGIRTTATIGKSLSYALKLPLIEFPSPLCFLPKAEGAYTIIGDAKMGQLYTMRFSVSRERIEVLSGPSLILKENFNIESPYTIDLRVSKTPNLDWVCPYVHTQFIQGNILDQNKLKLSYLR